MADSLAVGVDLGASKIATALVTDQGHVLNLRQIPTPVEKGARAVTGLIAAEINALMASAEAPIAGIGIGAPGTVLPSEGVVRNAINLDWIDVPLASLVRSGLAVEVPILLQKDTNAAALGEYYFGNAKGYPDFVYLAIGSGLGGGIIANGQIINGSGWQPSELGHLSLDPNGRQCACGLRGCAETAVSGPGLVTVTRDLLGAGVYESSIKAGVGLDPPAILAAARKGDALAQAALQEAGRQLGIIMAICVAVLNPALFVVGGGLGLAGFDFIIPASRRELERRVTPTSIRDLEIVPSNLKSSAIGPSCLVWYGSESRRNKPSPAANISTQ